MAQGNTYTPDGELVVDVLPDNMDFSQAFAEARKRGLVTFTWRGKDYNTAVAGPKQVTGPATGQAAPPTVLQAPDTTQQPLAMGLPQPQVQQPFGLLPPESSVNPDPIQQAWAGQFSKVPAGNQAAPAPGYAPAPWDQVGASPEPMAKPMMGSGGPSTPVEMPQGQPAAAAALPVPMSGSNVPIATGTGGQVGGGQPDVGGLLSRIMPQEMQAGPAKTPQEAEARVGAWEQFLTKVQGNPNLLLSLVKFGTEMLQPIQPGQTFGGHTGRAIQGGVDYLATLQNDEARRNVQAAEAERLRSGAAAQTTLLPGQVQQQTAQTGAIEAGTQHTQAQTGLLAIETQLRALDLNSKPALVRATIDKMVNEGILDKARADELKTRMKSDPEYQQAAIDLLRAQAEHARQSAAEVKDHFQRFKDLKQSFLDQGYDQATSVQMANQMMFAAGAQRSTNVEDADAQVQVLQQLYDASQSDPKNKRKGQTFQQFVADELAYGGSSGLPPATKALILARIRGVTGPKGPAPQSAAPPAATVGSPPPAAVEYLRQHPELAPQFEQKYGVKAGDYLK